MKRKRLLTKRLSLLIGSLLVALLIGEIALRLIGVSYPLPYVPDPYCGSRLRPNFSAWFTSEGRAYVHFNADGMRDREHTKTKPTNTLRIAVLGDSFAEALQVPGEQAFWSVLEKRMRECIEGQNVEVLNFGVSGFGTAQELEMLRHYVKDYQPDIVLLAFFAGNDVSDNSKRLQPDAVRPYYVFNDVGELQLDQSFREHPFYRDASSTKSRFKQALINRSRILQLAREVKASRNAAKSRANSTVKKSENTERGLDPVYSEPRSDDWREAWQISERLLAEMNGDVRAMRARFWVVTVTSGFQVNPDKAIRDRAKAKIDGADLFYADRRIAAAGAREGFPVIMLAPTMQRLADEQQVYFHGFANTKLGTGHWNEAGHRVAGELIAKELCDALNRPEDQNATETP